MLALVGPRRRAARRSQPWSWSDAGSRPYRVPRRLPSTPDQVAVARRTVTAQVDEAHPLYERRADLALAVSEVVTNALVHGNDGRVDGELELLVLVTRDGLRVCVRDSGGAGLPRVVNAGTDAVGGRGMALVDRLSDRWGFLSDRDGCMVWMDFGDCYALAGEGITA